MDATWIGVFGVFGFLLLLMTGLPVAVAMLVVGFFGSASIMGFGGALGLMATTPYAMASTYEFVCLPLFLLMGSFALYGGFGAAAYNALYRLVNRLPGGMAIATTLACGAFGAASGSSVAAAAIFTRVSLPEMSKYNYNIRLSLGSIAAAGTFATMIPPSINLLVYGMFTDASIARLFLAGIVPGLITILVYSISIIIRVKRNPSLAPISHDAKFSLKDKISALPLLWPIVVLAVLIMGGIYSGWFTATEAGAAGALAAFFLAVRAKGFKDANLPVALRQTAHTTAMIFAILIGSILFSRFIALSRIPTDLAEYLSHLDVHSVVILTGFLAMYFCLGMIVSALGMLAITLPIVAPVLQNLGYDLVWFGIIAIKMCEIAVVTPPVGLNCYVVKGVVGDEASLEDIFAGAAPFVICDIVVLIFLIAWPDIVTFLPDMIM